MNYKFNVDEKGDLSEFINIKLAIERPELWKVYVNGNEIKNESNRFWIDRDFPLMEIGEFLKKGKNEISLVAKRMSIHAEIMPIYIIGGFKLGGTASNLYLKQGQIDKLGSWKNQGYHFYSGKVSYTQNYDIQGDGDNYRLKLKKWNGTTAEVHVNGEKAGII